MENNIDKVAILIAESVAIMVEALDMKSYNDDRIQQGYSAGYNDHQFSCMANELKDKIEAFKSEIEIK